VLWRPPNDSESLCRDQSGHKVFRLVIGFEVGKPNEGETGFYAPLLLFLPQADNRRAGLDGLRLVTGHGVDAVIPFAERVARPHWIVNHFCPL